MSDNPTPTLAELLEWSKTHVMTDEEKEAQRQSWVRGEMAMNESAVRLKNPRLWKRVEEAAKKVAKWPKWKLGSPTNTRNESRKA